MNRQCKFCKEKSDIQLAYKYRIYVPHFNHFFKLYRDADRRPFDFKEVLFCFNCASKMNESILINNYNPWLRTKMVSLKANNSKRIIKKPIFPNKNKKKSK